MRCQLGGGLSSGSELYWHLDQVFSRSTEHASVQLVQLANTHFPLMFCFRILLHHHLHQYTRFKKKIAPDPAETVSLTHLTAPSRRRSPNEEESWLCCSSSHLICHARKRDAEIHGDLPGSAHFTAEMFWKHGWHFIFIGRARPVFRFDAPEGPVWVQVCDFQKVMRRRNSWFKCLNP